MATGAMIRAKQEKLLAALRIEMIQIKELWTVAKETNRRRG